MKSIERIFRQIEKENPYWSSYLCFVETIKRKKFSMKTVIRWFNKLVDEDNYDKSEKNDIIKDLINL